MNFIQSHLYCAFVALGGVGLVIAGALKSLGPVVDFAIGRALADPKLEPVLMKYRGQIETFFDTVDARIKTDLDAQAAKESQK